MAATQTKFWLVWHFGGRSPTVPHWTKKSAQDEATRLASTNPGSIFAVMASVDAYSAEISPVQPVKIVRREPSAEDKDAEIPF